MEVFVAIEGLDAAGKNTQAKILAERLNAKLYSFPRYDTLIGAVIKRHLLGQLQLNEVRHRIDPGGRTGVTETRIALEDPLMFQTLMLADKCHSANEIQSWLIDEDNSVVCDRWIPSAICYGEADGIDREWLTQLHAFLPQADLNIFLDVTPAEALRRRPEARDRYERDREKQEKVRINYQKMWATGGDRYVIIDGDGGGPDQAAIDVVAERVWKAVLKTRHASLRRPK